MPDHDEVARGIEGEARRLLPVLGVGVDRKLRAQRQPAVVETLTPRQSTRRKRELTTPHDGDVTRRVDRDVRLSLVVRRYGVDLKLRAERQARAVETLS